MKNEGLTVENLRTFSGYEHCTDEAAEEVVSSIHTLVWIVLEVFLKKEGYSEETIRSLLDT